MTFKINNYVINTANDMKIFLDKDQVTRIFNGVYSIDAKITIFHGIQYDYSIIDNFSIVIPEYSRPSLEGQFSRNNKNLHKQQGYNNHRKLDSTIITLYKYVSIYK